MICQSKNHTWTRTLQYNTEVITFLYLVQLYQVVYLFSHDITRTCLILLILPKHSEIGHDSMK